MADKNIRMNNALVLFVFFSFHIHGKFNAKNYTISLTREYIKFI